MSDRFRYPDQMPAWLSDEDLDFYVGEFERTGFTGGLNRYRNIDRDFDELSVYRHHPIDVPALFIGGSLDGPTIWGRPAIDRYSLDAAPLAQVDHPRRLRSLGPAGAARRSERRTARLPRFAVTRSERRCDNDRMPYQFTPEGEARLADVVAFMDEHIYPNEAEYEEQAHELGHDGDPPLLDKLKAAARERGLWNLFLPHLAPDCARHEAVEPRLRPDLRAARQGDVRLRGPELLGARHGQHGDPQRLRVGDGQARLAGPVARGRDALGVLDDRARRGVIGRHEHRAAHHPGRERVRAQRDEVVLVGCAPAEVSCPHRDGEDRPRRTATSAAVDDRRAQGHAGRQDRPHAARLRLRPRRWASGDLLRGRAGRRPTTCSARRAAGSPCRRPASARGASTTACARSASPSGRSG